MMATRRDGIALAGRDRRARLRRPPQRTGAVHRRERHPRRPTRLHVFCVNRSTDTAAPVTLDVGGTTLGPAVAAELLTGPDAKMANTFERPDVIRPDPFTEVDVDGPTATFELPPLSFAALSLGR